MSRSPALTLSKLAASRLGFPSRESPEAICMVRRLREETVKILLQREWNTASLWLRWSGPAEVQRGAARRATWNPDLEKHKLRSEAGLGSSPRAATQQLCDLVAMTSPGLPLLLTGLSPTARVVGI